MKTGTESRGKTITAVVLLVVAVLVLARAFWPSSTPAATPSPAPAAADASGPPARRVGRANTAVLTETIDPRLRLDLLAAAENTKYEGRGRNIFRSESEPQEIPKPIKKPIVQQPEIPQGPPPPPPINIKFFGFASQPGEPKRVFLSENGDVFVAAEGEIVNRRYRVVRINPTSIEVEDVLNNNRQSIPLQQG